MRSCKLQEGFGLGSRAAVWLLALATLRAQFATINDRLAGTILPYASAVLDYLDKTQTDKGFNINVYKSKRELSTPQMRFVPAPDRLGETQAFVFENVTESLFVMALSASVARYSLQISKDCALPLPFVGDAPADVRVTQIQASGIVPAYQNLQVKARFLGVELYRNFKPSSFPPLPLDNAVPSPIKAGLFSTDFDLTTNASESGVLFLSIYCLNFDNPTAPVMRFNLTKRGSEPKPPTPAVVTSPAALNNTSQVLAPGTKLTLDLGVLSQDYYLSFAASSPLVVAYLTMSSASGATKALPDAVQPSGVPPPLQPEVKVSLSGRRLGRQLQIGKTLLVQSPFKMAGGMIANVDFYNLATENQTVAFLVSDVPPPGFGTNIPPPSNSTTVPPLPGLSGNFTGPEQNGTNNSLLQVQQADPNLTVAIVLPIVLGCVSLLAIVLLIIANLRREQPSPPPHRPSAPSYSVRPPKDKKLNTSIDNLDEAPERWMNPDSTAREVIVSKDKENLVQPLPLENNIVIQTTSEIQERSI